MGRSGNDSAEVATFMAQFSRLKDWSDDTPDDLYQLAMADEDIGKICEVLQSSASALSLAEIHARERFASPVNPAFVVAWRDYEERYESIVSEICFDRLIAFLGGDIESTPSASAPTQYDPWTRADCDAVRSARGLEAAIDFAEFNAEQEDRWDEQPDFIEGIRDGISTWESLKRETGFDLRRVFRRRALIPFTLVPRHVANTLGENEGLSLLQNLKQAHDAFTFGATHGAIALMRSVMEAVLRDLYHASGNDLSERIRNLSAPLPRGANDASLHRLRKLANEILHLNRLMPAELARIEDEKWLEREIASLLLVLRSLIEGAPKIRK